MKAAHDAGLDVPAEVSVVGYDDIEFAAYVDPPLTTVRNPKRQRGNRIDHPGVELAVGRLTATILALFVLPASAAGKEPEAPVRVLWNSSPDQIRARETWDARLSLLQGPGGYYGKRVRPVIVVTELAGAAERLVPMTVDLSPNTFRATVGFPREGLYEVAATGFDPRDPERSAELGPPVRIEPAGFTRTDADDATGEWWPWAIVLGGALAVLVACVAARPVGRADP